MGKTKQKGTAIITLMCDSHLLLVGKKLTRLVMGHSITWLLMIDCFSEGAGLSAAERMMMTVAEIVKLLVQAHQEGRDVNLNK